jgi:enoyl-CoA hydratase/carnithine racemase
MAQVFVRPQNDVAVIEIDYPPANAVTLELTEQLQKALDLAINSPEKAIVLTAAGNSFGAGMDLKQVPFYNASQQSRLLNNANQLIYRLYGCDKPVVAAVNGHAIGAGLMVSLAADYRLASDNPHYQYGLTEVRAGIPFPACPAVLLRNALAPSDVRYLSLFGKSIGAEEALSRGIFDELIDASCLLTRAIAIARDLAQSPADSYAAVKRQFRFQALQEMRSIIDAASDPMLDKWLSDDGQQVAQKILNGSD